MKKNTYLKFKDYCIRLNEQFGELKNKQDECYAMLHKIAVEYAKEHPDFDMKFKVKKAESRPFYKSRIANDKDIERRIVEDKDMGMLGHKIRVDNAYIESFLPSVHKRIELCSKIQSVEEVGEDKFLACYVSIANMRYYSAATAGCYERFLQAVEVKYAEDKGFFKNLFKCRKSDDEIEKT